MKSSNWLQGELIQVLLAKGANSNGQDKSLETPLHLA
jgi:ankyrin repeat protein